MRDVSSTPYRTAYFIVAIALIALALYDAAWYLDFLAQGRTHGPLLWRAAPPVPWATNFAYATHCIAPYILNGIGPLALLAAFPRPRLYKLLLLTALLLGTSAAFALADTHLATQRGPFTLTDGNIVYLGGGWGSRPAWYVFAVGHLLHAKTTALAWLMWCIRPRGTTPDHCPKCDYLLLGLSAGRCPECGAERLDSTATAPPSA